MDSYAVCKVLSPAVTHETVTMTRRKFMRRDFWDKLSTVRIGSTSGAFREPGRTMTSITASDLSDLLNQAARNAVVKARSQSARSMTVSQYKAAAMARSQSYQGDYVPLSLVYRLELPHGPVHDALHSLLAAALRGHTKEDRVQLPLMTGPAPASGFPLTELVDRLTELSVLLGPTPTAETFLTSLSDPRCPFVEYYLLSGISALESTKELPLFAFPTLRRSFPTGCHPHSLGTYR